MAFHILDGNSKSQTAQTGHLQTLWLPRAWDKQGGGSFFGLHLLTAEYTQPNPKRCLTFRQIQQEGQKRALAHLFLNSFKSSFRKARQLINSSTALKETLGKRDLISPLKQQQWLMATSPPWFMGVSTKSETNKFNVCWCCSGLLSLPSSWHTTLQLTYTSGNTWKQTNKKAEERGKSRKNTLGV